MENIIAHQLVKLQEKVLEEIRENGLQDIGQTAETLFRIVRTQTCELLRVIIEATDEAIANAKAERKANGLKVKERRVKRRVQTSLGEIEYCRTYYETREGERIYPLDHMIGIESRERVSKALCAKLVNLAAEMLDEMGILTPGGKTHWRESTILSILSNEKYKGDALLQKTFTVDFLTKKHKRNEGEVQQYYVSGNHEAIIPPDEFEQVQAELARRKRSGRTFSGNSVFASRLICGDCGGYYGQKVWHSNDPYRKVIWRCNRKYGKGQRCSTPTLSEDAIKALFVKAYNLLLGNRETIIEDAETLVAMLEDTAALDTKIAAAQEEIDTVVEMNKALIREHAAIGMEQAAFDRKAKDLDERFRKADAKLNRLKAEKQDRLMRVCSVKKYVENLRGQAGPIEVWNEQAWCLLVTQVTVHADGSAEFLFRGENRITVR